MSKKLKVCLETQVDGTDEEVLFHFCAFSDHALDHDFEENIALKDLIRRAQGLLLKIPEEHENKPEHFWKISEIILNHLKENNEDITKVIPKYFCMTTLSTYKNRYLQAKNSLSLPKTFPHISEFWTIVGNTEAIVAQKDILQTNMEETMQQMERMSITPKEKIDTVKQLIAMQPNQTKTYEYADNLFQKALKEDELFRVRGSKAKFCRKYNIHQSNLSKFIKTGGNTKISEKIQTFYEEHEEKDRWKLFNLTSPSELSQKNKYLCYKNGHITTSDEFHEKIKDYDIYQVIYDFDNYKITLVGDKNVVGNLKSLFSNETQLFLFLVDKKPNLEFNGYTLSSPKDGELGTIGILVTNEYDEIFAVTCFHNICPYNGEINYEKQYNYYKNMADSDLEFVMTKCKTTIDDKSCELKLTHYLFNETYDIAIFKVIDIPFNKNKQKVRSTDHEIKNESKVWKWGKKSNYTTSTIKYTCADYFFNQKTKRANQIQIQCDKFFESGDCGAVVVLLDDNYPFGILHTSDKESKVSLAFNYFDLIEDFLYGNELILKQHIWDETGGSEKCQTFSDVDSYTTSDVSDCEGTSYYTYNFKIYTDQDKSNFEFLQK
eukprot:gene12791-7063_t